MRIGTLFSGIGAPEFALKNLGVKHSIEFACDNDPYVKQTYLQNHHCINFFDDVATIKTPPKTDLIIFGFPCQPFSIAGKRKGLTDIRGRLVIKAIEVIRQSNPNIFIAENVEGLITRDQGKTLNFLITKFKKMGYIINHTILNSLDFGIPQNRRRLWIVGSKTKKFSFPTSNIPYSPLYTYLDHKVDKSVYATKDFLCKPKVIQRLESYDKDHINCITQTISRNGSSSEYISYIAAVHNAIKQARKPTVIECCRLFGLPSNFIFPNTVCQTRRYNILANSMVVPVLEAIISKLTV